jgi:large subunit ribosomal protein L4
MKVDVLNSEGQKVNTVDLSTTIFEAPINTDLMYQAYIRQMANARQGTHSTKSRGEVSGGGRKPWRQKGTGRARQGSIRSPQWVGGGKVHTPKPRDYSIKMPRKMRRAALRSALTVKAAEASIVVLDVLEVSDAKTLLANYLNIRDLMGYEKVILPLQALDVIESYLG